MRRSSAALLASLVPLFAGPGCVGGATPYPPSASAGVDAGFEAADQDASAAGFDASAPPPPGDGGPDTASDGGVTDAEITDADVIDADFIDADVIDAEITDADITDADVDDGAVTPSDAARPGPDGPPESAPREP